MQHQYVSQRAPHGYAAPSSALAGVWAGMPHLFGCRREGIAIDVGRQDGLYADNERLHQILDGYGIRHEFDAFEGGHGDVVAERFEERVLPLFSRHMAAQ